MLTSCSLALGFVFGSLFIPPVEFKGLDDQQQSVYDSIVRERRRIYSTGLFIGSLLGFIIWKKTQNTCHGFAVLFTTAYFVYKLLPKSTYMLEHLREDQVPQWTEINRTMTMRYHIGFLTGLGISLLQIVK